MSNSSVKDILNVPSQWPASFPKPQVSTRVLTYVFRKEDDSKVEKLLNFIKEKTPKAKVSVVKDKDGYTMVSITQLKSQRSNLAGADSGPECGYGPCAGY